eukprot:147036_1
MFNHYDTNPNKTWRKCDFDGCNRDPRLGLFKDGDYFISHIAQHTHQKPYKCNVLINGRKCVVSCGSKYNYKAHWVNHFKDIKGIKIKPVNFGNKKNSNKKGKNKNKHSKSKKKVIKKEINDKRKHDREFDKSYHVSVRCHVCKKQFNHFNKYKLHLENHYINNKEKVWKQCDFDTCKRDPGLGLFSDSNDFIGHISTHTKDRPFTCDIIVNGIQCTTSCGSRRNLYTHFMNHVKKKQIIGLINNNNNNSNHKRKIKPKKKKNLFKKKKKKKKKKKNLFKKKKKKIKKKKKKR